MSILNRLTFVVVDELGMDPLRDKSFEAIRSITEWSPYTVTSTDEFNLPLIADRKYGELELWWAILIYNGIADSFTVTEGTRLKIPEYGPLVSALSDTLLGEHSSMLEEL